MPEISRIRFWCNEHKVPLKNCGSGRVFAPTHGLVDKDGTIPDEFNARQDKDGWFDLDTSELYCPADEDCNQDWTIQAE